MEIEERCEESVSLQIFACDETDEDETIIFFFKLIN